jgi:hypothetical protein
MCILPQRLKFGNWHGAHESADIVDHVPIKLAARRQRGNGVISQAHRFIGAAQRKLALRHAPGLLQRDVAAQLKAVTQDNYDWAVDNDWDAPWAQDRVWYISDAACSPHWGNSPA